MWKTKIEENWIDSGLNLTQHFPAICNIYCLLFMRLDMSFCLLFSWQRYFYLQLKAMRNSIPILRFVPVISLEAFGRKGGKATRMGTADLWPTAKRGQWPETINEIGLQASRGKRRHWFAACVRVSFHLYISLCVCQCKFARCKCNWLLNL